MTQELIDYVVANVEVETVYFKDYNEEEWTLQPDTNHTIAVSREDIIGTKAYKKEVKDGEHGTASTLLEHDKSIDEVIKSINAATTLEEANTVAGTDDREAVLNALNLKQKSFSKPPKK